MTPAPNADAGGDPEADADPTAGSDPGLPRRVWDRLAFAVGWFVDTFRGYSGVRELRNRDR